MNTSPNTLHHDLRFLPFAKVDQGGKTQMPVQQEWFHQRGLSALSALLYLLGWWWQLCLEVETRQRLCWLADSDRFWPENVDKVDTNHAKPKGSMSLLACCADIKHTDTIYDPLRDAMSQHKINQSGLVMIGYAHSRLQKTWPHCHGWESFVTPTVSTGWAGDSIANAISSCAMSAR